MLLVVSRWIAAAAVLCGLAAPLPAAAQESFKAELARRREVVRDFYAHLRRREREDRQMQAAAEKSKLRRAREESRAERAREAYVRSRPVPDWRAELRQERLAERELEREERKREMTRARYVQQRDRLREAERQGPRFDEDLEVSKF